MPPPSAPPPKKSLGTQAPKKAAEKKKPKESSDDSSDESGESSPVVSGSGECLRNRKMKKLFPLKQDRTKALVYASFLLLLFGSGIWAQPNAISSLQIPALKKKRNRQLSQSSLKQPLNQLQQRRQQRALQTAQVRHMEALWAGGTPGALLSLLCNLGSYSFCPLLV